MARKRKRLPSDEEGVLLPHVSKENMPEEREPMSEEARRAKDTVDTLLRDLFGEEAKGAEENAKTPVMQEELGDGIVSESLSEKEEKPNDAPQEKSAEEQESQKAPNTLTEENAEPLSFKEYIESSAEDFRLLLDMDYEDELGNAIGFERIRAYHERGMNGKLSSRRRRGKRNVEFERQSEEVPLRRAYAHKRRKWLISLCISAFLLVLIAIYERPLVTAKLFGGPFDGTLYPSAYILLGVQLLLLDAALCYKPLWEGLLRLVRFSPVDYSFFSALVVGSFLYHFVLLFLPHSGSPMLFLSPAALCISLLCAVELLNTHRESMAFDVISARRQKYALVPRISVGAQESGARSRLLQDDENTTLWYVRPINFVRNYFSNTAKRMEQHRTLGAQLLLTISVGVALAIFSVAMGGTVETVWCTLFASVLLCVPATSLLLTAVPMYFAAALRLRGRGAIVGEGPVANCTEGTCIVLPDHEIFAAMLPVGLRLSPECDAHHTTVLTQALLEKLKSPLSQAFGVDMASRMSPAALALTEVHSEGAAAMLKEQGTVILLGTPRYVKERGIELRLQEEPAPDALCVAINGCIAALFGVQYTLFEDVPPLLNELQQLGIAVKIRTQDPCVRAEVLAALLGQLQSVEISKPSVRELSIRTDRVDASIVGLDSCKETARTYAVCHRIRRVGFWGRFFQAVSVGLGAVLAAVFAMLGNIPSAFTVTLWLLSWCAVYATLSYFFLRPPSEDE